MTRRPKTRKGDECLPDDALERSLFDGGATVIVGLDEVGRGALAGPVCVGAVAIQCDDLGAQPIGIKDSKLLTAKTRELLAPRVVQWAHCSSVGYASAREIDDVGISRALSLAAIRALTSLGALGASVIVDGPHDFVRDTRWHITAMAKADLRCVSVAAASILAKVSRDAHMIDAARRFPGYAWESNKGYASPAHREGLSARGACSEHRRSWSLPGVDSPTVLPGL